MFGGKLPRTRLFWMVAGALIVILSVGSFYVLRPSAQQARTSAAFSDFLHDVQAGRVRHVTQTQDTLEFDRADGARYVTIAPQGYVASNPTFVTDLAQRGITFDVKATEDTHAAGSYGAMAFGLLLLGFAGLALFRAMTGRVPTLEKARTIDPQLVKVTFADVAGVDEAKDEVSEIVDFLKEPQRFADIGGRIPRGILLIGPPGTGKTLLARSMAGEAGVPFISASGSDFVEMYAGVGASRIRKLFKEARRHKACIIFIDELDAVGRSRGGNSLSHEEREQTLNQLLVEMDGFTQSESIIIVGATNRHDILDPALLRPGRFDRQVMVGNPDIKGREQILRVHARKVALVADVDLRSIARGTPGFSGADLANLVNEAALAAGRDGRDQVTHRDMEGARDKVLMGVERRSVSLSEMDRVNCAYHEAGHAVVAALLPMADPLHKVTIIPRGRAMGVTMQLPEADRHTYTKGYLETQVAVLMGGRAAEELFMNHMTSGASNDIERATDIAQHMVCEWGMSALGMRAFRKAGNGFDGDKNHAMSEATARRVDEEIEKILNGGYDRALDLLNRNRAAVKAIAEALLDVEALEADELKALLARSNARA